MGEPTYTYGDHRIVAPPGTQVVHDQVVAITPDVATMAGLFTLNLTQWRTDP